MWRKGFVALQDGASERAREFFSCSFNWQRIYDDAFCKWQSTRKIAGDLWFWTVNDGRTWRGRQLSGRMLVGGVGGGGGVGCRLTKLIRISLFRRIRACEYVQVMKLHIKVVSNKSTRSFG